MDQIFGTHSLSIHGRVYTNLPNMSTRANVMSSIRSFVLDSLPDPNVRGPRNETTGNVDNQDTVVMFNTLQQINPLASALRMVGDTLINPAHSNVKRCVATVNESLMHRSVSAIANHDAVAEEIYLMYTTNRSGKIPRQVTLDSEMCETVCYPMFFPFAESGWITSYSDILDFLKITSVAEF